jgi:hypothetical protein
MLIDSIFEQMAASLEEGSITKMATKDDKLPISDIKLFDNFSNDIDLPLSKVTFKQNIISKIATDYDGKDKAILKEKGRAHEHEDIIELAHPGTAVVAENYKGSGEVENLNQQRKKILDMINRTPTGFNFHTFAEKISEMIKVAEQLESSGDVNASFLVMREAARLARLKKKSLTKGAATEEEMQAMLKRIDDAADENVKKIEDFYKARDEQAAKAKQKDNTTKPSNLPVPYTSKMPSPAQKAPNMSVHAPESMALEPSNRKMVPKPSESGAFVSKSPEHGLQKKTFEADEVLEPRREKVPPKGHKPPATDAIYNHTPPKSSLTTEQINKKPLSDPRFTTKKTPALTGKKPSTMSSILNLLKRHKLLAGAIAVGGILAPMLYNLISGTDKPVDKLKESSDAQISSLAQELERSMTVASEAIEKDDLESAIQALIDSEGIVIRIIERSESNSLEAQEAEKVLNGISDLSDKVHEHVQQRTKQDAPEEGKSSVNDKQRIMGMQKFFKHHYDDPNMPITGNVDQRLEASIEKFVHDIKNELAIAPKMLTVENILDFGDSEKLEVIKDIWDRPHMHVERAASGSN